MGEDEVVGNGPALPEKLIEEREDGGGAVVGGVGGDEGGVEVDVRGGEVVEEEAGVGEVGEGEDAEADELEGVEVGVAVAEGEEVGLELLEMAKVVALGEGGEHVLVQVGTAGPVVLGHLLTTLTPQP